MVSPYVASKKKSEKRRMKKEKRVVNPLIEDNYPHSLIPDP